MRQFKVIDVQWHVGHAYEMLKFPFVEWHWLHQYKRSPYSHNIRGDLSKWFAYEHFYEPQTYDAAILHLDQECLEPDSWFNGKGRIYKDMNEVIQDIPKIVIMHGTPHFPEAPAPYSDSDWMRQRLREVVGSSYLVVNSHEAARQWGIGKTIIHGLDANEWFCLRKKPRVITVMSSAGMTYYYDRSFLSEVRDALKKRGIQHCHIGVDYHPESWDDYRTFLGESLIYFNPTRESPMPRARTEAMLSGCCIVTTPGQDASDFIEDGRNGFIVPRDAEYTASLIERLVDQPGSTEAIGQQGRLTATARFGWNRFSEEWRALLTSVT